MNRFNNPLKYQTGGQMKAAEEQLISAVAQSLGAKPEQVKARLDEIKANPQETQVLQQALQLMQQDKNAGFNAILNLFSKSSNQSYFKEGGKIKDFICKHAKGGYVAGCNCKENGGEIEINKNGKRISRYSDRNTWGKATSQGDTTINGSYSDHSQEMKITPKGTIYREWNNEDMFPSVSVANQTYFDNHPLIRFFSRNFGIGPKLVKGNEDVVTNMNAAKDAHQNAWIPSDQEGGELTRKEAFRLAQKNKGYRRGSGQTAFAYANAKQALGNNNRTIENPEERLHGRALRQRARQMIAGQTEMPKSSNILSAPISYSSETLPKVIQMQYPTEHNESLTNLSFNEAFDRARRAGAKIFWWPKGKYQLYTTELAQKPSWTNIDVNSLPEDIQNNLTGNVEIEIPEIEEPNLSNEYLTLQPNTFEKELFRQRLNSLFRVNNSTLPASGIVYKNGGLIKAQNGYKFGELEENGNSPQAYKNLQKIYDPIGNLIGIKYSNGIGQNGETLEDVIDWIRDEQENNISNLQNASGTITQGKPRSKIGLAIDNNSNARHLAEAGKRFVKSPVFKWPLAGLLGYGGYRIAMTPFVQGTGEIAPAISKFLFPTLTQLDPKVYFGNYESKLGDVFWAIDNPESNKNRGKVEKIQKEKFKNKK